MEVIHIERVMPDNIAEIYQTIIKWTWTQFETDGVTLTQKNRLVVPRHKMQ